MVVWGGLWVPHIRWLGKQVWLSLQGVQAYIGPPIAVCFIFGILWPRLNGQGAISSLLTGFVLGAVRFIFEVLDKTSHYESSALRRLGAMNYLHFAVLLILVVRTVYI